MAQVPMVFGDWEDLQATPDGTVSYGRMTLDARHLSHHWRRCSLSSDFWARYTALFSPLFKVDPPVKRESLESTLSYLLNELFENCAKFSGGSRNEVIYRSWLFPDRMAFQMTNHIEPSRLDGFIELIKELLGNDPNELYFKRLEANAETDSQGSGLGYLTLMKDYQVRFGFRFTKNDESSIAVEVQAHIDVKEI